MGCIRLLLAISVILGHLSMYWQTAGYTGGLYPYYSVQIFFVISGFYISLVLNEKYNLLAHGTRIFYLHRYLRLAPTYWLIGAITIILTILSPQVFPLGKILQGDFAQSQNINQLGTICCSLLANIFLFGLDLTAFLPLGAQNAGDFLVIPQSWSLGTELWFYVLSPFLIKFRNRVLIAICLFSLLLRFGLYYYQFPFVPWQQRFFPCELLFFIFGIFAYRIHITPAFQQFAYIKQVALLLAGIFAALIMCGGYLPVLHIVTAANSLALGLFTLIALPFIFSITRNSSIDRLLGEFSYPAYLWHICLGYWLQNSLTRWDGWYLVLITLLFSIPIVFVLEIPLSKWRNQRELGVPVGSTVGV